MFLQISDPSQVSEARRLVCDYARKIGLPQEHIDRAAVVVTELATNLVKHGGRRPHPCPMHSTMPAARDWSCSHSIAARHEPMSGGACRTATQPPEALATGWVPSSVLPTMLRIYSRPGQGSVIIARILARAGHGHGMVLGAVLAPYPGEAVCGDALVVHRLRGGPTMLLVDGSGHGVEAARAAEVCCAQLHRQCQCDPARAWSKRCTARWRDTRGGGRRRAHRRTGPRRSLCRGRQYQLRVLVHTERRAPYGVA